MKQFLKILVIACLIFSACKSNEVKDITGVYQGEFPCGDCTGIDNKMTLNTDSTFVLEKVYKGKGNGTIFKESGKYTVTEGQLVLDLKASPFKYKIDENYIELLDIDGNIIKSDLNYKLIKQE
ncbi:copper resistance protein NlpE [Polaribacter sp. L3A8]|uniref:copper resistance protein NlpE n=1 Tax=Polaribacter sp. L3A8 TaxID=2686361 RepID=UPI00131C22C0|nr:copper resistance protein NlpE [Polaribacter sp. L3A8]